MGKHKYCKYNYVCRKRKTVTELDLKGYIYLQLFIKLFNNFNGTFFIVGFCVIVVATPAALIFVSLRFYDDLGLYMQFLFPFCAVFDIILIVIIVPLDAKVRIDSVRYLEGVKKKRIGFSTWIQMNEVKLFGRPSLDLRGRRKFIRKRLRAFLPVGIQIWFFGFFSISTSKNMIEQLFNSILLLLSL